MQGLGGYSFLDDTSLGCGIVMEKEQKCKIRTPIRHPVCGGEI